MWRNTMRATMFALALSLGVGGCAGVIGDKVDKVADYLVKADTPKERELRGYGFGAVAAIAIHARVTGDKATPDDAIVAAARLAKMRDTIVAMRAQGASTIWTNLSLAETRFALYKVVGERAGDVIAGGFFSAVVNATSFASFPLSELGTGVKQLAFANAALADVDNAMQMYRVNDLTEDEFWDAMVGMINDRLDKITVLANAA